MMYSEFMELAGYNVTADDYGQIIEPMYNVTPKNVDKITFIGMLNKKFFVDRYVEHGTQLRLAELQKAVNEYNNDRTFSNMEYVKIRRDVLENYSGKTVTIDIDFDGSLSVNVSERI